MGLFDKKFCDICGEKIGLLGNRKLEDGNMCKDCAKLLSPLFSDRRSSTIDEIKQQLAYREQNKQALAGFSATVSFGDSEKVYIDTLKGNFVVSRRNPGSWSDENPDVQALSSIMSCSLDVDEDRDEIYYTNSEGEEVSYNPPRYKYSYDFTLRFKVNNPYFDDFDVRLNSSSVEGLNSPEYIRYQQMANEALAYLLPGRAPVMNTAPVQPAYQQGGYAQPNMYQQNGYAQPQQNMYPQGGFAPQQGYAPQGGFAPQQNPYAQQSQQGFVPQQGYAPQGGFAPQQPNMYQQNGYAQSQPNMQQPMGWFCQSCGAQNNGGGFCQSCGAPKQ